MTTILDELATLTDGRISKSGINHRFRKIIELADTIENNLDYNIENKEE